MKTSILSLLVGTFLISSSAMAEIRCSYKSKNLGVQDFNFVAEQMQLTRRWVSDDETIYSEINYKRSPEMMGPTYGQLSQNIEAPFLLSSDAQSLVATQIQAGRNGRQSFERITLTQNNYELYSAAKDHRGRVISSSTTLCLFDQSSGWNFSELKRLVTQERSGDEMNLYSH